MTTKADLHHLVDELGEAEASELLECAQRLRDDKNERLAEDERARVELDELAAAPSQGEPGHVVSPVGVSGAGSLRPDSLRDTPLAGELKGRTPLSLLSDVLNLADNITVGLLAQAIVGYVLGGLGAKIMPTYYSWDLEMQRDDGSVVRVEVKTCSTTQSWSSSWHDPTSWGCGRIRSTWNPGLQKFVQGSPHRPADIYIFVRRDGDVFEPTSYRALTVTTAELEILLGDPSRRVISKAVLTHDHSFVSLAELQAEVIAARDRLPPLPLERSGQVAQTEPQLWERHA